MAAFCLTQLVIVTLNILLVVLFVVANTDFCGSVFETQVDHALVGHVMAKTVVADEFECHLKCLGNNSCKSFNVPHNDGNSAKRRLCELNNETRQTKPEDLKWKKGFTYYGSVQVSCIDASRNWNRKPTKIGQCHPGYKGKQCQTAIRSSCEDIRDSGDFKGDGEYWIDPEKSGKPFKVFCNVTSDGVCGPIGVADSNKIPDARITASTLFSASCDPQFGRLHGPKAWCPKTKSDRTDFLQVDMGAVRSVCAVATQGFKGGTWRTSSYKLNLSTDGVTWNALKENNVEKVFAGNTDNHGVVQHFISTDVKARFVRFYPVIYNKHPSLRVEIYVLK